MATTNSFFSMLPEVQAVADFITPPVTTYNERDIYFTTWTD